MRYGAGSPYIDIRLPCGSGVDVLLDPAPDTQVLRGVVAEIDARQPATLDLGLGHLRRYLPTLRLVAAGSGPEVTALEALAAAQGVACEVLRPRGEQDGTLALGRAPDLPLDQWTSVAVLFHDHEWERAILPWALAGEAFLVGAQGGKGAREARSTWLDSAQLARLHSPVGLIPAARTPGVLALSVLAEVVAGYEKLLDVG
jgi:xanthine dehydrogenase accessory factor